MVNGLKMIEERITDRILTGQVGSISPVVPSLRGAKRPTELAHDVVEDTVQEIGSTVKSDISNQNEHNDMASKQHKCSKTKKSPDKILSHRVPVFTAA